MKEKSLVKAIEKAGLKVEIEGTRQQRIVRANGKLLAWYLQGESVTALHGRFDWDKDDYQSDYHGGRFFHVLKDAVSFITTAERD